MKNENLISIIIPMYNAEKTILKTVESLQNQTHENIEIIIVDDGSDDHSYEICTEKIKDDKRVKIIKKENGGVSSARNCGINNSKGKFIQFVDSDDLVEKNYCEELLNNLLKESADFAICSYIQKAGKEKISYLIGEEIYSKVEFIRHFSSSENPILMNPPWNKLYKSEIIKKNRIKFDEKMSFGEDFVFNVNYLDYCKKIVTVEKPLYIYIYQDNGLCNKKRSIDFYYENNMKLYMSYEKLLNNNKDNIISINLNTHFLFVIRNIITSIFLTNSNLSFKEKTRIVKRIISNTDVAERLNTNYKKNTKNIITYICIKYKLYRLLSLLINIKTKNK